ncbi:HNH endonuclease [Paenibacillus sp. IB182496]|uniref:HNH endonuclease n=1 Tax=Paenibacillus sabuli TaxID=2772509 RepID=A0A927BV72_9BACL|nr:HNH endonuclease [Paenibacillus sabuli]MBD2846109.1 HNH endonuclease [Paenibacillus sabuli]
MAHDHLTTETEQEGTLVKQAEKQCAVCAEHKPLSHFLRRTGRRAGPGARRGTCRACRKLRQQDEPHMQAVSTGETTPAQPAEEETPRPRVLRMQRPLPTPPPLPPGVKPSDPSVLRPTRKGIVWMRGRTDKGRRWQQESDLETAVTLVKEHAAVVVNRHTVRRLYSNRNFRHYILTRDNYTCFYCGEYGDTLDHLVPRAKGGHTTPVNCVCTCSLCNQSKADRNLEDFIQSFS